jgi:hypothetical protein
MRLRDRCDTFFKFSIDIWKRALLRRVRQIIPEDASAIFLGDGEFDSVALQQSLDGSG